jgi:26S proteasome regulatory subunit N4
VLSTILLTSAIVRTTRARIIRLKNDYKDLMSRIEKGLHEHYAKLQEQDSAAPSSVLAASSTPPATAALTDSSGPAFAKINSVAANSPADTAGLKVGDRVVAFGSANWMNHERLAKVAEIVNQNEGVSDCCLMLYIY